MIGNIVGATTTNIFGGLPVAGASLWLDASDATTFSYSSGTRVSEWRDKTANAYHFTQATSARQPDRSSTQNGLSAVKMAASGTGYYVTNTSMPDWSSSAFTVLGVIRGGAGAFAAILGRNSTGALQMGFGSNGVDIAISRIGQATATSNLTQGNGTTTSQITYKSAGISSGSITVQPYQNKTAGSAGLTLSSMGTGDKNSIGASSDGAADIFGNDGFICELILYPSQLSDTDRETVETYLMNKWGI